MKCIIVTFALLSLQKFRPVDEVCRLRKRLGNTDADLAMASVKTMHT